MESRQYELSIKSFSSKTAFKDLSLTDLHELVITGKGGNDINGKNEKFGKLTAEEFSNLFTTHFEARKFSEQKAKSFVIHLYLVMCSHFTIGNSKKNKFAQNVANHLYDNGFKNINIHCYAKPSDAAGETLHIKSTAHGYLTVYQLRDRPCHDWSRGIPRKKIKELIVDHCDQKEVLNHPQHLFIPRETKRVRRHRLLTEKTINTVPAVQYSIMTISKDNCDDTFTSTAKHLAAAFYHTDEDQITVKHFQQADDAQVENSAHPTHALMLGHTSSDTIGGYSVHEFIRLFSKRFASAVDMTDLYLVGCEIGLIDQKGHSLAQQIANKLYKKGFKHIKVHAVAKPENAEGEVMVVEVIDRLSAASQLANLTAQLAAKSNGLAVAPESYRAGYISTYLYSAENYALAEELRKKPGANHKEIGLIESEARLLPNPTAPDDVLNRPQNIFLPNETLEIRHQRIMSDMQSKLSLEHNQAIALLQKRSQHLRQKKKKILARDTDIIINRLLNADNQNWNKALIESTTAMEASMTKGWGLQSRLLPHRKSTTIALLHALINHDFITAEAIIARQSESNETNISRPQTTNSFHLFKRNKPAINQHDEASEPVNTDQQKYLEYKAIIFELIEILKNEQESLRQRCFSLFHRYEINTKRTKQIALTELLSSDSYASLTKSAIIIQHKTRVMRSKKTSRVSSLVHAIINPDAAIDDLRHDILQYQKNLLHSESTSIKRPLL